MSVISNKDEIIIEQLEEIRSKELQDFKYRIGMIIKDIITKQRQRDEIQKQIDLAKVSLKDLQLEQTALNILEK